MELTQSRDIGAPPLAVWSALNDPVLLKDCIPGCESLDRVTDTEWRAVVATRIGPVQARFNGRVLLADIVAPTSYTLRFEGQGGAAGFANGEAKVALDANAAGGTTLRYEAHAKVGGKIAQLGSRLVDGVAAKLADDFFARFADKVARPAAEIAAPAPAAVPVTAQQPHWIRWGAIAAIVVVAALLYLWRRG